VLEALTARGALFFNELQTVTQLLPGHLEEALRELAAAGLITSDAFAAVRRIAEGHKTRGQRRTRRRIHGVAAPIGRWSLFPGLIEPAAREEYLDCWCRQLLLRYGVVFRDLLARESSAPNWQDLVGTLRRMELRGEVRGGRFVSGVAGEQYALPDVVEQLRQSRDAGADEPWIVLSAADPLNLFGLITSDARVTATHRNALIVQNGRLVASRQAGTVEFHEPVDQATQWAMRRAMTTGKRSSEEAPNHSFEASL
jgi:ATP-dependent Lhr-like helicase